MLGLLKKKREKMKEKKEAKKNIKLLKQNLVDLKIDLYQQKLRPLYESEYFDKDYQNILDQIICILETEKCWPFNQFNVKQTETWLQMHHDRIIQLFDKKTKELIDKKTKELIDIQNSLQNKGDQKC